VAKYKGSRFGYIHTLRTSAVLQFNFRTVKLNFKSQW